MPDQETDVIVIGAGLSGLVAARDMARAGIDVVVLESADRVGGRAMGVTSKLGSRLDLGGQWIGSDHHAVAALADELGLTKYLMHSNGMPEVIAEGRKIPLWSPSMVAAAPAIVLAQLLSWSGATGRWNDITLDVVLSKVPGRLARRLLEVVALVSWTADLDRYSLHAMSRMVRAQHGFRTILATIGGAQDSLLAEAIGTIPELLAADLDVRTGRRVTSISRDDTGVTVYAGAEAWRANRVIVTVPAPMAARIQHDPPLPDTRARLEGDTHMGTVYKAIAVYHRSFWRDHANAEFAVLDNPGRLVVDSSAPGGPGHLCMLASGPEARAMDAMTVAERQELLLTPLAAHLGEEILTPADWLEKAWHLDEHVGGGYIVVPNPGTEAGLPPHSYDPVGRIHWAGSETATGHPGYLDGAVESGQRVAREVAEASALGQVRRE